MAVRGMVSIPPQRTLHFNYLGNKGLKKFELCETAKQGHW